VTDPYEVLQVDRHAEPEVIRGAYRALARRYHPDFGGSARLMASINQAWAILGDPTRRSAYDSEPEALDNRRPESAAPIATPTEPPRDRESEPATGRGLAGRRPSQPQAEGSILDFGRYAGWTVGGLADHDPDYLEWLARTPIGRPLSGEIDAALARRAAQATTQPAGQAPPRRRAFR
jgi:curved DNA-binding protein CbpA